MLVSILVGGTRCWWIAGRQSTLTGRREGRKMEEGTREIVGKIVKKLYGKSRVYLAVETSESVLIKVDKHNSLERAEKLGSCLATLIREPVELIQFDHAAGTNIKSIILKPEGPIYNRFPVFTHPESIDAFVEEVADILSDIKMPRCPDAEALGPEGFDAGYCFDCPKAYACERL
jgi:hypothetical protein